MCTANYIGKVGLASNQLLKLKVIFQQVSSLCFTLVSLMQIENICSFVLKEIQKTQIPESNDTKSLRVKIGNICKFLTNFKENITPC